MPYVLLWIESLAASLLLVATVWACVARLRWGWVTALLLAFTMMAPLCVYVAVATCAGIVSSTLGGVGPGLPTALVLVGGFVAGVVWIARRARRGGPDGRPAGASWPRGRLAVALAAATMLHVMTIWNLDLARRQQLAALRADASALALAVAPLRVADRDNAALDYQEASQLLCPDGRTMPDWKDAWDKDVAGTSPLPDANDPDLRRFLAAHEPAHRLLLQAAAKGGCYFEHDYFAPSIGMALPETLHYHWAADFLCLSARQKAAAGDLHGALADVNAKLAMIEHISGGPLLIHLLLAEAHDRRAIALLQTILAARPVPAEALAAVRIDPALSYRRQLQRALRSEEAFRLATFADVGRGDLGPYEANAMSAERRQFWGWPRMMAMAYRLFLLEDDLACHQRISARYRELAAKPFYQARRGWQDTNASLCQGTFAYLTAILAPALSRSAEIAATADARRATARAGLAAARYRAAHSKLPDKPEDLLGESLPAWPTDPFDGKPLRWKRADKDLLIYSIGPDAKDDAGAPFDDKTRTGDIVFRLGPA